MSEIISHQTLPEGEDAPKIEFPCAYPIKVLGEADETFTEFVVSVIQKYAPDLDLATVSSRDSSKGTFRSVTVVITATGEPQIKALFEDLKSSSRVKMVI